MVLYAVCNRRVRLTKPFCAPGEWGIDTRDSQQTLPFTCFPQPFLEFSSKTMVLIGNAFVLVYLVHLVWLVENSHFNLLHLFQCLVTFSLINFDSRNFDVFQAWLELSAPLHSWTDLLNWTWSHWLMSQNAEGMYFRFLQLPL